VADWCDAIGSASPELFFKALTSTAARIAPSRRPEMFLWGSVEQDQ